MIEVAKIVLHEADEPDFVVDLFHTDLSAGENASRKEGSVVSLENKRGQQWVRAHLVAAPFNDDWSVHI